MVPLPLLATKIRLLVSLTATALGLLPTATVRSTTPVLVSSTLTVLLLWLTTKARPVVLSISTATGAVPTTMVRTMGLTLALDVPPSKNRTTSGSMMTRPDGPRSHVGRKMMERFIVVSQSCCSDVQVLVHPYSSDRKDRIGEVCLRDDYGITLLGPNVLSCHSVCAIVPLCADAPTCATTCVTGGPREPVA